MAEPLVGDAAVHTLQLPPEADTEAPADTDIITETSQAQATLDAPATSHIAKDDVSNSAETADAVDTSKKLPPTPPISPPYWLAQRDRGNSTLSDASRKRMSGALGIRLTDNTDETSPTTGACWARSARIDEYVIVSGESGVKAAAGLGSYAVFVGEIDTLNGGSFKIRKRYSEFDKLRSNLVKSFPHAGAALPEIPPKSIVHRFQPKFLEKRRVGLAHFLNCVLLNPEFSSSPVVKDFLFD